MLGVAAVRPALAELSGSGLATNRNAAGRGRFCGAIRYGLAHAFAQDAQVSRVDVEVATNGGTRRDDYLTVAVSYLSHDVGDHDVPAIRHGAGATFLSQ